MHPRYYLLLPDIRSAHNVGSIFRTAESAGIAKIFLSGTSPRPIDRFGRKRKDIAKVALGAEDMVSWEHIDDPYTLIQDFQKNNITCIALEQNSESISYTDAGYAHDTLFIVGNEVDGVDEKFLESADVIVEIPMVGNKESLNVSVATGILLFHARSSVDA